VSKWIRHSVRRSLQRLHTDYLDVVYCHDVEFVTAAEVGSWFVRFLLPGRGRGVLLRGRSRGMCRRRAHRVHSVRRSLQRLHTDYLDVVYCHDVEFVTAAEVVTAVRAPVGSWFVRFLLPGRGRGVLLRGRSRGMCRRRAHRTIRHAPLHPTVRGPAAADNGHRNL
jgi:aryl-alcohol dehydrogenase-like predicted oxidoreductase